MSEPVRLNRSKGLAGALLASAKADRAPEGASGRLLAGAAAAAVVATKSTSLAASMGSTLGHAARWATWKWVAIGIAGAGSVVTAQTVIAARATARGEARSAAIAQAARPGPARPLAGSPKVPVVPPPPAVVAPPPETPTLAAIPAPAPRPVAPLAAPVSPVAPVAARAATPVVPAVASAASPSAPASHLALEIAAIDGAKRTLAAGDAATVMEKMDAYDLAFPQGMLAAEANALRIEALVRLGRREDARAELARFQAKHPGSPLQESLRRVVGD